MSDNEINQIKQLYATLPEKDIIAKGYKRTDINFALKGIKRRSRLESTKLMLSLHPECYKHTQETKTKLSKSMKEAHKNGTAHSWHNGFSYAELFFEKIIKNNFNDQQFKHQWCVGKYRLDFFWPQKSRAIEIDGKQHDCLKQKQLDNVRDDFIEKQGIKILRIKWLDLFHETKCFIKKAKAFIDEQRIINIQPVWQLEENKKKNKKRKKRLLALKKYKQYQIVVKNRLDDLKKIDLTQRGSISLLSRQWNVSHTHVRRYIKNALNGVEYKIHCSRGMNALSYNGY